MILSYDPKCHGHSNACTSCTACCCGLWISILHQHQAPDPLPLNVTMTLISNKVVWRCPFRQRQQMHPFAVIYVCSKIQATNFEINNFFNKEVLKGHVRKVIQTTTVHMLASYSYLCGTIGYMLVSAYAPVT